ALVDILCGVLSGGLFGTAADVPETGMHGGIVGNFFGAFRIDALRDGAAFRRDLDRELGTFERSTPAPGAERVVTAGTPERENTERFRREGVPIDAKVWEAIDAMADRLHIERLARFIVG
ncbi:MAG TPA: Ldh family oxidoreductase, partial [Candidatus Elarobacter sp.]|nr:Ldh family oxidoreductase [Candidatus Elarobacter sp.]